MTRINVDLSDLLAPIRQMREEIQKMNEALRSTVQLQSQMAAHQRQAAGGYSPTKSGLSLEIQDRIATRGGPLSNVYSIGTGAPIPPSNINPTGSPLGMPTPNAAWQILNQRNFASSYAGAMANQATFGTQSSVKEREDLAKALGSQADKSFQVMRGLLLQQTQKFSDLEKTLGEQTAKLEIDPQTGKILTTNTSQLEKLNETIKQLNKTNAELAAVQEAAAEKLKTAPPPPPGGGGGNWWDKFGGKANFFAGAASIAGLGLNMVGDYKAMQALGYRESASDLREIPRNIGTIESLRYQRLMARIAPTTGEQYVEAFGNILTPGKNTFKYLGIGNRQAQEAYAKTTVNEEFKASEAERSSVGWKALGGLAMMAGGAFLTAKTLGIGGFLGGFGAMAGGYSMLKGAYQDWTQAQTSTAGKAQGGVFNVTGAGLFHDNVEQRAAVARDTAATRIAAQTEEMQSELAQNELKTIAARRLSMGIDENLAAYKMQTAATAMAGGAAVTGFEAFQGLSPEKANALATRYAKLGYSIPEVGSIYNTYASMMGTTQGAGRLLGLSRAGVGSVEQMASNVLGISAVSGKQGDIKQLENIFAKAFEAGLKGAPAIQRFSQAAMEMSQALKIQSATGAAGILGTLTGAMAGPKGSALMYMEEAKSGLAGLAGATGATTGLMGTLKVLSGAAAGLGVGTGLGAASRSNVVQVQEALQQLSSKELTGDYTKMTGLARKMVGAQISSGVSPEQAIANVRRALEGQVAAQTAPFAALYQLKTNGKTLSSVQEEAKKLVELSKDKNPKVAKKAAEDLRNLMARFEDETTGMTGLEVEGSSTALLLGKVPTGDFKRGQQMLEREKGKGAAKAAADFSTVNYKTYLNKAAQEAAGTLRGGVSDTDLLKAAQGLGIQGATDQEKIAALKAQVGLKADQQMTFGQLATATSLLSSSEEVAAKSTKIEAFSDTAVRQLIGALNGQVVGPQVLENRAGTQARKTPEQIEKEKSKARTKSAVGGMMP